MPGPIFLAFAWLETRSPRQAKLARQAVRRTAGSRVPPGVEASVRSLHDRALVSVPECENPHRQAKRPTSPPQEGRGYESSTGKPQSPRVTPIGARSALDSCPQGSRVRVIHASAPNSRATSSLSRPGVREPPSASEACSTSQIGWASAVGGAKLSIGQPTAGATSPSVPAA